LFFPIPFEFFWLILFSSSKILDISDNDHLGDEGLLAICNFLTCTFSLSHFHFHINSSLTTNNSELKSLVNYSHSFCHFYKAEKTTSNLRELTMNRLFTRRTKDRQSAINRSVFIFSSHSYAVTQLEMNQISKQIRERKLLCSLRIDSLYHFLVFRRWLTNQKLKSWELQEDPNLNWNKTSFLSFFN
jgi:hypothetical protein